MRYFLIVFMILTASLILAVNVEQCTTTGNIVSVKLNQFKSAPDFTKNEPNLMISSETYALPYKYADLHVNSMNWKVYDANGRYIRNEEVSERGAAYISQSFTFREMNGFTVNIKNQIQDEDYIKVLNSIEFELVGSNPIDLPQSMSPAFIKAYRKLASNFETSYLRNLPISRPKMLIISHPDLPVYLANFISWKKSKGYEVTVVNKVDLGNNAVAIRDSVRSYYEQYKYDYLLILGDVTGAYTIPTNVYTSPDGQEQDADDNFYTMLSGDDYFPEMLVGRFSFGDPTQLYTLANKTIYYERSPSMLNTAWMRKGLVVAGNYAEGNLHPVTPVQMSKWLREKMLSEGYTQVDTAFYTVEYPVTTQTDFIRGAIRNGVQYVSYRGWGAADGWHYPAFHSGDLDGINNGAKMPIVFSIVCNTGDFSNESQNPCFGEKWMLQGTLEAPDGCVGFVGPSDLHTKTNLNNTISTGIFSSIFDYDERCFGSSVLAGKVELYKNYPLNLDSNDLVAFYFHVYNILSDPSLNMWMLVPQTIPASVITDGSTFSPSDSHITINASNLDGAMVTGTRDNINYTYATVHNGEAILPIDPLQTGNLFVTISKENFVPLVSVLTPTQAPSVSVINNSLLGQKINAGESYALTLTIKNYSSSVVNNVIANLSTNPSGLITINNASQTISTLASQATTTLTYNFVVNGNVPSRKIIRFDLAFPNQTSQSSFELMTGGAELTILSSTGALNIGTTSNITFTAKNTGSFSIQNASVAIQSLNTAATVSSPTDFGSLAIGQTANFVVPVTVASDCYVGRNINLYFTMTNSAGYQSSCYYTLTAGNPTINDPTGPDSYGYYAYGSNDIAYPEHPAYQWTEIDSIPNVSIKQIMDDGSYTVNLPFTFRYYGQNYTQLTICSNGWISFVPTWMSDFNNLYIPAALGPYAMIAPYWDDLKGKKVAEGTFENMRICHYYDSNNNRFIVEWNNAYSNYNIDLMDDASLEKFQVILYPIANSDGNIVFQYHTIDNPAITSNYSTVGIENHLQNDGLTYSFANFYPASAAPLQDGLAIKFTTVAPDSYVLNEDDNEIHIPFHTLQNYPNPFNPETRIEFNLNKKAAVTLEIYNLKGQKILTITNPQLPKGQNHIVWNGKDENGATAVSGVYLYKLISGSYSETKKMILMK